MHLDEASLKERNELKLEQSLIRCWQLYRLFSLLEETDKGTQAFLSDFLLSPVASSGVHADQRNNSTVFITFLQEHLWRVMSFL